MPDLQPPETRRREMKVYVITASDFCGEDTKICSIWSTEPAAQQEKRRIQPDELAVEVKEYEVQSEVDS